MRLVLDALKEWVSSSPDKKVWTFLNDKADPVDDYTYQELENSTDALAAHLLQAHQLHTGDRILLVFFPGLDFTVSLLACFKAGLIAVPVFPPDPRRLKKDLNHFVNIQISSGAQVVLTNSQYDFVKKIESLKSIFSSEAKQWPELQWIKVDDVLKKGKSVKAKAPLKHTVASSDIAFLQYTSGSTSDPKGVMISHENLAHNLSLIIKELAADTSTVNVSWLPQYHDMGLIGSYLGIIYCGGTGFYLSPISFLKDPVVWIKAMSQFRGTHTQAPNFAYALVARKFKEFLTLAKNKPSFDLSTMRHMINAAEPVDFTAMMDFYSIFTSYGLQRGVIFPTYGLAEHTVFVCSGGSQILTVDKASLESGDKIHITSVDTITSLLGESGSPTSAAHEDATGSTMKIVGCGFPFKGENLDLIIVHSVSNQRLGDDSVGEVWVSSPSKACGYWNLPELTAHDFHAKYSVGYHANNKEMKPAEGEIKVVDVTEDGTSGSAVDAGPCTREYLRTGDLGFMHDQELFICGRMKDLIIVRGSNHYPQDIERTAEACHSALRAGCSAAFALKNQSGHTESVIYVAELKDNINPSQYGSIIQACKESISREHGLALQTICLLKTRSVPKTTSGKIARSWCRKAFLENTLAVLHRWDSDGNALDSAAVGAEEDEGEGGVATTTTTKGSSSSSGGGAAAGGTTQNGGVKYTAVAVSEQPGTPPKPVEIRGLEHLSEDEVRNLPLPALTQKLESVLVQVASQGASPLSPPIDPDLPISSLGLDSMTVVQFKGVLENRFYCDIPDEFLFTPLATLKELTVSVHLGTLSPEQRRKFDAGVAAGGSGAGNDGNGTTVVMPARRREPLCPWFTCCY